jgi:hypothetical protein
MFYNKQLTWKYKTLFFLLTFMCPFSACTIAWHTSGMVVDIAGTDVWNVHVRWWYESPVAKKRNVTAKHLLIGMASLMLVFDQLQQ